MNATIFYLVLSLFAFNICSGSPLKNKDISVESSIISPQEGSVYSYGDNVSIVWVDSYNTLCSINVVQDNTSIPIAQNVETSQGQYLWMIPQNLSDSRQGLYNIQIISENNTISSGQFTIKKGDAVSSNDSLYNNSSSINKDPMSGAKATASITIIGAQNQQLESLATLNAPGSYILGALFSTAIAMVYF